MGSPNDSPPALEALAEHSRFVQRVRRRHAAELPWLPPGLPTAETLSALVARALEARYSLPSALRVTRQLALERLAVLDIEQAASLEDVTATMTALAEVSLEIALAQALADADARHGAPLDAAGDRIDFWIVGMGKLGARELNVSSDIDLIYVYEASGQTAGAEPVSAHEYFSRVARSLYALIGDNTDEGFVFRVDLALRPNGNSGPPVVSLAMLEEYFQVQGREWERFAWLKSRVVAPRAAVASGRALALRSLVTPFVYRRYLDYGVFEGLRQLHGKIREEAQRRAAGRPERSNDVKLSRGGIREIEFIVQLLLVVRGGQFPEIRTRSTLRGLHRLATHGLMKPATADRLAEAYRFLRRVEHRIQYLDDQQTHLLPAADADLGWIARSLGLTCHADACELLDRLGQTRELVATEFDALLHDGQAAPVAGNGGCKTCGPAPLPIDDEAFLARLPAALAERTRAWAAQPRVQTLRDNSKQRLARLIQRAAEGVEAGRCSADAALRFIDWMEPLLRRESYLALLVERPEVQQRLLGLLGLARWPSRYLMQHPGVIDELADARLLHSRFDRDAFTAEMNLRHAAWHRSGEAGEEALLDGLRRAHHAEVFRTLVRDVEGHISVEQVADDLSALADAVLDCAVRFRTMGLDGSAERIVPLPGPGASFVAMVWRRFENNQALSFDFSSFTRSLTHYRFHPATGELEVLGTPGGTIDGVVVTQRFARSIDGTAVPYFLVHRDDLDLTQRHPAMVCGYGGFNVAMLPTPLGHLEPFIRAGGILVHANLRGGGEYGKHWHDSGRLAAKWNVFADLFAVAEAVIAAGLTSPDRLAMMGGSNGGLLAGAAIVHRPDLWRVVVASVPIFDLMEPFPLDAADVEAARAIFLEDYGSPSDTVMSKVLYSYSPYHNVKAGTAYPAVYQVFGEKDLSCRPFNGRKFTAALRAASSSGRPVHLRVWRNVGHGSSDGETSANQMAEWLAFVMHHLGMPLPPSP